MPHFDDKPILPMPFNGTRFFQATAMWSDDIQLKYVRALWFYWNDTKATGIPNDDDGLRRLCRCDVKDWMRIKGMVFDNNLFFKLEDDGKWHQTNNRRVFLATMQTIEANHKKTEAARIALAVTRTVTKPVTESASPSVILILDQKKLDRVESRIAKIKGQFPLSKDSALRGEYKELQEEKVRLMDKLEMKA